MWFPVKDENGDILDGIRRSETTRSYPEEAFESFFIGEKSRRTKKQFPSQMEQLGYRWEILYKPKK
jgi:hypothetical protein